MQDTIVVKLAHYVAANDYMSTFLIWTTIILAIVKLIGWIKNDPLYKEEEGEE